MKGKLLESKSLIFFSFIVMLFLSFFVKSIHIEPIEIGAIKQILNPADPKGPLAYDPHRHYDYIFAFVAQRVGYANNFTDLAGFFWFFEILIGMIVLIKLCNYIFKENKMVLVIAIMFFLLSLSGQTDQKTMLMPIYLLSIYYFLKNRWFISGIFAGLVFYFHIGYSLWWLLTAFFALLVILFKLFAFDICSLSTNLY